MSDDTQDSVELVKTGISRGNEGRYREAILCFDKAIEIKPNYALAWSEKGFSLRNLGRNEEAVLLAGANGAA
jgi:Flp pilus assembly protein TadD